MAKKVRYSSRVVYFGKGEIGKLSFDIGGDFFDIPGLLRSEMMSLDYPAIVVTRVEDLFLGTVAYDTKVYGTIPEVADCLLRIAPDTLWNSMG